MGIVLATQEHFPSPHYLQTAVTREGLVISRKMMALFSDLSILNESQINTQVSNIL